MRKWIDHLSNSKREKNLNKNPIKKILEEVSCAITSSSTLKPLRKNIIERSPLTPRIYGFPKIHEYGRPLRPIFNTIGGPTYLLAKCLAQKLKTLVGLTESYIKEFSSILNELKHIKLDPRDTFMRFNIVSL